jgi:general nucleoside transport system permease protein
MDSIFSVFSLDLLRATVRLATPILLPALAGMLSDRAGVLNLALEGMMLLGAFLSIVAAFWLKSTYLGVLVGMASGGLLGAFFFFLYKRYKVDLVVLAIALNLFIQEMTVFALRTMFGNVGSWSDPSIKQLPEIAIPLVKDIPLLGPALSGYNAIVYFSWFAVIAFNVVLFHTRFGRHLRAVGESQSAAEAVGINVTKVKLFALVIGGSLAALGGAFLSVGHLTEFTRNISNGRGWIGLSAALFGFDYPVGVFLASMVFGGADALAIKLQATTQIPSSLVQFFPNLFTIIALVLVALRIKGGEYFARIGFRRRMSAELGKGRK